MLKRLLALAALVILASPASAWWEYGHHSVASVAWLEAKPQTRAAIRRLIAQSGRLETPTCPIRTLEDAAYWPDCIKKLGERFSYAYSWHFQNVDICKPFDLKAPCREGNCVSAQIERNFKLLKDREVPVRERVMALAFLAHFVGDIHQPLHAGDKGDFGGNAFKMNYGVIPSNLHSTWDGLLADRAISSPPGGAAQLIADFSASERSAMRGGGVGDWSRESWEAAREFGYGALMADPCGPVPETRPKMDEATTQRLIPVVRRQIVRGGERLARLLDEALS
ncbi:MAG TPA: S1/P1 nuclease [Allosphingosinicella sp.]|nr:S1/P1 nuclease [Allosphingosinicella sp.]